MIVAFSVLLTMAIIATLFAIDGRYKGNDGKGAGIPELEGAAGILVALASAVWWPIGWGWTIPVLAAVLVLCWIGWNADRSEERTWFRAAFWVGLAGRTVLALVYWIAFDGSFYTGEVLVIILIIVLAFAVPYKIRKSRPAGDAAPAAS